jgi:hypothetical protein
VGWVGVHIRCFCNGYLGFRSYSGSLLNSAKVSKTLLPHHSAPRSGSVCPHSGITTRAAATGRPCPVAAKPASCRFTRSVLPAFGQRGLTGRLRSRSTADQQHSGLQAGLSGVKQRQHQDQNLQRARSNCRSWLAGDSIASVYLKNRGVCIAGKPAPTEKQSCISFSFSFRFGFRFGFCCGFCSGFYHSSRPVGRCALAFDLDLTAPISPRPNAGDAERVNRQDAGLAALGQGWPIAAARGASPE